jgi:hypothetical protein
MSSAAHEPGVSDGHNSTALAAARETEILEIDAELLPRPLAADRVPGLQGAARAAIHPLSYAEARRLRRQLEARGRAARIYGIKLPYWVPLSRVACREFLGTILVPYSATERARGWAAAALCRVGLARFAFPHYAVVTEAKDRHA